MCLKNVKHSCNKNKWLGFYYYAYLVPYVILWVARFINIIKHWHGSKATLTEWFDYFVSMDQLIVKKLFFWLY